MSNMIGVQNEKVMDLKDNQKMNTFDALLFSVIIEIALLQLRVAKGCSELRQKVKGSPQEGIAARNQAKLDLDREQLTEVLRNTLVELLESGHHCGSLEDAVSTLTQQSVSLENLKLDHDCLKLSRISRGRELKTKRKVWLQTLRGTDNKITVLRDRKEDELQNARMRLKYSEKWLNARSELLELKNSVVREPVPKPEHENRVHSELCKAYELQIQEREDAVGYWRVKYADDTSCMNLQLAEKREQLQHQVAKRENLQKLYDLHAGEMRAWLTFKRERAARQAREERLRKAATNMQAWWRGVMVRRALGAYRNLKNNTKKPSAKNKKK